MARFILIINSGQETILRSVTFSTPYTSQLLAEASVSLMDRIVQKNPSSGEGPVLSYTFTGPALCEIPMPDGGDVRQYQAMKQSPVIPSALSLDTPLVRGRAKAPMPVVHSVCSFYDASTDAGVNIFCFESANEDLIRQQASDLCRENPNFVAQSRKRCADYDNPEVPKKVRRRKSKA